MLLPNKKYEATKGLKTRAPFFGKTNCFGAGFNNVAYEDHVPIFQK